MMFTTQAEWEAAYSAAHAELKFALDAGVIECVPSVLGRLAAQVATAAIRHGIDATLDDVSSMTGVHVERITIERLPDRITTSVAA
jgi:hypothetical protein